MRSGTITACRAHHLIGPEIVELRGHLTLADDHERCETDLAGTVTLDGAAGSERIVDLHVTLLLQPGEAPGRPVGLTLGLDPGADATGGTALRHARP